MLSQAYTSHFLFSLVLHLITWKSIFLLSFMLFSYLSTIVLLLPIAYCHGTLVWWICWYFCIFYSIIQFKQVIGSTPVMKEKRLYFFFKEINCGHSTVVGIILVSSYGNTEQTLPLPCLLKVTSQHLLSPCRENRCYQGQKKDKKRWKTESSLP